MHVVLNEAITQSTTSLRVKNTGANVAFGERDQQVSGHSVALISIASSITLFVPRLRRKYCLSYSLSGSRFLVMKAISRLLRYSMPSVRRSLQDQLSSHGSGSIDEQILVTAISSIPSKLGD